MLIVCPHCQAKYQLDAEIHQAIFVCHRCQTEFGVGLSQAEEEASLTHTDTSPEMPLFDYQEPIADSDQQPETASATTSNASAMCVDFLIVSG